MGNALQQLTALGQSVWYDNISRGALRGELAALVTAGEVQGVTSNPTIFEKAISGGGDYDDDIRRLVAAGHGGQDVFWELAVSDIRAGADLLRPVFERTEGADGYVSLEVSPDLAADGPGTVAEAKRLFAKVSRPNVMIKIPASRECWDAIEECTALGLSINVTMMFAPSHYDAVAEAYMRGLERRAGRGQDLSVVASVASVFVSRVDTLVDKRLAELAAAGGQPASLPSLLGKAAVANAKGIYARFQERFNERDPRWRSLHAKGARVQRPLWASTSTKNPAYRDVMYVEELIGPDTVDTMPPATITAFRDHGQAQRTVDAGQADARRVLKELAGLGIDMDSVGATLQREGLMAFSESFHQVLQVVEAKSQALTVSR